MTSISSINHSVVKPVRPALPIETCTIFKTLKSFLSSTEANTMPLVNKRFHFAAISSKTLLQKEPLLTDGYGDFVLLDKDGPVEKETFKKAYVHMNALLPQIDRTPRSDRLGMLNAKLQQIKPGLKAIFIPRTVYELFYLTVAQEEEMDLSVYPKLGCKCDKIDKEFESCWHNYSFWNCTWKDDASKESAVVDLAFRLNKVIARSIKPSVQGLSEKQWVHMGTSLAQTGQHLYHRWHQLQKEGCKLGNPCIGYARNELMFDTDILKQVISLECSEKARNAFVLYRGSKYEEEPLFVDNHPYSISFGLSPFAGYMHDIGACAAARMYDIKRQRRYALCIPFTDTWQDTFLIPPATTIAGLNGHGEKFHARTRCLPLNFDESFIEGYCCTDYRKSPTKDLLISPLKASALKEKLNHYQKDRIDFQI